LLHSQSDLQGTEECRKQQIRRRMARDQAQAYEDGSVSWLVSLWFVWHVEEARSAYL